MCTRPVFSSTGTTLLSLSCSWRRSAAASHNSFLPWRLLLNSDFFFGYCAGASHGSQRTPNVHISRAQRFKNTTKIPRKDPKRGRKQFKPRPSGPPKHPSGPHPTLRNPNFPGLGPHGASTPRPPPFGALFLPTMEDGRERRGLAQGKEISMIFFLGPSRKKAELGYVELV